MTRRTSSDRNPQAVQMADESMVRNLAAQIACIWPQERPLVERHALRRGAAALDVGCGTGEFAAKLLELRDDVTLLGVDIIEPHLALARERCAFAGDRAQFRVDDAFHLSSPDDVFDLVACRHMLQAVPEVPVVLRELVRVTRPGGVVHLVAEDYGLMTLFPTRLDSDVFWRAAMAFVESTGTDLRIGRKTPALLEAAGCVDVRNDVLVIDTIRAPRDRLADVWRAWRDGYSQALVEHGQLSREEVVAHWEDMISCIENGYACWLLPVVSGRKPGSGGSPGRATDTGSAR